MSDMKAGILQQLQNKLKADLDLATQAYATAHSLVTENELKAEGKYDTRAIEAGYLAGAQKKRKEELEQEIALLDEVNLDHQANAVCVGSLVEVEFNQLKRWYFVSSTSGGTMLQEQGLNILVISAFSPIGSEMIGQEVGDSFIVESAQGQREYKVLAIK